MLRSLPGLPWLALSGLLHLAAVAGLASGALREAGPAGPLAPSFPEAAPRNGPAPQEEDAPARAAPGRPRPGDGPARQERSSTPDTPPERPAGAANPDRPTGRLALMALGTHKSYETGPRHRYALVVVSPEKREKAVLKRARRAHPDALVFAYLNTMDVMLVRSLESPRFWKKREDWFLHDADGERVRVRVRNYKGPRARYGMNVAHPGWQRYLGARAVEFLEMGYDGVQLDNVETDTSYRLYNVGRWISAMPVEMTEARWYRAEEEMLRVIRTMADEAGFPGREIIFNHIRAGEPDRAMDYLGPVDGANSEDWMNLKVEPGGRWGWRSRVGLIRRAGAAGKRTNVLARASLHSPEEALFAFASYLMAYHGEDSTFWYGKTYRAEEARWFWFYDAALGEPAGEIEEIGASGVFARPFTHGLVVVNPRENARTVTLEAGPLEYMDEAFEPAHRLELRPKEGKILFPRIPRPAGIRILEAESCLEGPPERREGALKAVRDERWSAGAALEMGSTSERCVYDASLPAGTWRLVVEGTGQGRNADAALVSVGGETRRAAFGFAPRQVQEIELRGAEGKFTLRAAEAGVIVDRIVLIPLDGER